MPQDLDKEGQITRYLTNMRRLFQSQQPGMTTFDKNVPPPPDLGRTGDFAAPSLAESPAAMMDKHSRDLIFKEKALELQKNLIRAPYTLMENAMKGYTPRPQIPISSETPPVGDIQGIKNATNIGLVQAFSGLGRASPESGALELGVGGGKRGRRPILSDNHLTRIQNMGDKLTADMGAEMKLDTVTGKHVPGVTRGFSDALADRFFNAFPEMKGKVSNSSISSAYYRMQEGGRVTPDLGTTIGSDIPNKALDVLKEMKEGVVTPKWIEDWVKQSGANIRGVHTSKDGTKYYTIEDRSGAPFDVRVPTDPKSHGGLPAITGGKNLTDVRGSQSHSFTPGNRFDAAYGPSYGRFPDERTRVNQAGEPYYNTGTMEKALELRSGYSRDPEGWQLMSPDYGPRTQWTGHTAPSMDFKPPDLDQLKLPMNLPLQMNPKLSTEDILKAMREAGGGQQ